MATSDSYMLKPIHKQDDCCNRTTNHADEVDATIDGTEGRRPLCACVESNGACPCCESAINNEVRFQSWNRWKAIALFIVTVLIGIWLVVYITLSHVNIV